MPLLQLAPHANTQFHTQTSMYGSVLRPMSTAVHYDLYTYKVTPADSQYLYCADVRDPCHHCGRHSHTVNYELYLKKRLPASRFTSLAVNVILRFPKPIYNFPLPCRSTLVPFDAVAFLRIYRMAVLITRHRRCPSPQVSR